MKSPSDTQPNIPDKSAQSILRIVLILAVIGVAVFGYAWYGSALSLESLATKESTPARRAQTNNPKIVIAAAFFIYVAITGLSLPGAAILTLVIGWFFGFWQALLMVSFASTAGATLAFLISRFGLRDTIQSKFGDRLASFNEALEREGAFYLFTLRLIPAVPFFVINLVMGLTPINARTFWWVSQIGMLPGTAIYVYAGSQFPSLETLAASKGKGILTPELILAFVLLGLFPIAIKKIMAK